MTAAAVRKADGRVIHQAERGPALLYGCKLVFRAKGRDILPVRGNCLHARK